MPNRKELKPDDSRGVSKPIPTFKMFDKEGNSVIVDNNSRKTWEKKGYTKPTPKKKRGTPVPKPAPAEVNKDIDFAEYDEQALQNYIDDNELDIDLNDFNSIEAKQTAVFEAAKAGDEEEEEED